MLPRRLVAYGLLMAALTVLYYAFPGWHIALWGSIGVSSAAAVVAGVVRNRPRRRGPWLLMAGAALAFVAGDITATILSEVLGRDDFPSIADAVYLGVFVPLLLAGLIRLTRSGASMRDWAGLIDALMLTAGAGLLSWIFLINPYVQSDDLTALQKAVAVAYPLCDVLVLGILARLAIGAVRTSSVTLLTVAVGGMLVADVLYGLGQVNGAWQVGGKVDIGWVLFYAAWGAAALHPAMSRLTEPRVLRQTEVNARRLVLGLASLIAPVVLLVEALRGAVDDGVVIAVMSAVLAILVIARLSTVTTGLRRTLARERELRRACELLLSTTRSEEVTEIVYRAVAHLLPPNTPHRALLVVGGTTGGAAAGTPAMAMVYTDTLDVADQLAGFQLTLRCRLTVGDQQCGDLYIAADEIALVGLQQTIPVLGGQAATMIDHIKLNQEINHRDAEAYFRTLVLHASDVILIVDADNRISYASPSAPSVFGIADLAGSALLDLVAADYRPAVAGHLSAVRAGHERPETADWMVRRPDGGGTDHPEPVQVEVSARDLRTDPTVRGLVLTLRDVTERRRLERELMHRAYVDPLTGLANRLLFQDRVRQAATRVERTGTVAGVLVVNLDDFGTINDTMGHDAGDALLVAVGERLVAAMHPGDLHLDGMHGDGMPAAGMVARLGADEFAVIVEDRRDVADIERVAESLLTVFGEPFLLRHGVVTARVSIGVATTADVADRGKLLSRADIALGVAKSGGKSRWRRYEASLHNRILERMQLRAELDQAISDGQFLLHYQPIVELATGRTLGFEALVRWQHPTRGMIPPLEFIQIAEESGQIVKLGEWVLRTAVATAVNWQDRHSDERLYVSVNVSARQFRSRGFVDRVYQELTTSGLPPQCLVLEITESLLLGDHEQVWSDLSTLRAAGVRVSIDDFGTGYSSLSYLHQVPIDVVKLDKSFVDTIATSPQQLALVNGIIKLTETLGLDVVAEGIETDADRALLVAGGCGYGQGFFFARPMPAADVTEWIRTHHGVLGVRR